MTSQIPPQAPGPECSGAYCDQDEMCRCRPVSLQRNGTPEMNDRETKSIWIFGWENNQGLGRVISVWANEQDAMNELLKSDDYDDNYYVHEVFPK